MEVTAPLVALCVATEYPRLFNVNHRINSPINNLITVKRIKMKTFIATWLERWRIRLEEEQRKS